MTHLLPLNKKEFYIDLYESRYYFPGDVLKGTVVLNLAKPTKTNHIRVTLTGTVQADKSTTQVLHTSWDLATSPLHDGKPYLLEAQTHRLPFEFELPNDDDSKLPSSLKVSSSMGVKYVITAIHDRPFIPEQLCSAVKKEIRVLERIDITQPKYGARAHVAKEVRVVGGLPASSDTVHLSLTLPQYAVVRGDVLPMEIHIKHYRKLIRTDGIKVHLIRRVYTGKERKKSETKSIKSNMLSIDLTPENGFEQKINTKILVPTHTPPTLSQTGRILAVEYAARVIININDSYGIYRKNNIKLESHVVIGTYPKPNLSIDDDDDDDEAEEAEDMVGSDDDEEELTDGDTTSITSSPAHIIEPPTMRQPHSASAFLHQRQSSSSSFTVVDPTTHRQLPHSSPSLTTVNPTTSRQLPHSSASSPSLMVVDPTVPRQQPHSSPSSTVVNPTASRQPPHSAASSPSFTVVDPTVPRQQPHSSPLMAAVNPTASRQPPHSSASSPSLMVVDPTVPRQQPHSSPSFTVVDPTVPRQQPHSSPSFTVVDPTVPTNQPPRPVLQQRHQSSSSSVTVVDPSVHTGRRHSYLPRYPSDTMHEAHRHSLQQASVFDPTMHGSHRHSLQQPMDPKLRRNESTVSTLSSTSSSSSGSSAMLVEPPMPTGAMATMPDLAAYVPSKSSGQHTKRPPLHLHLSQQPSSPPISSPGGFVVPMPYTPSLYPPPLPPRRPSAHPPNYPWP